ncbi:MAG: peptidase MA family metallohydrolase, partial [Chloroflexota bacterium]
SEPHPYFYDDNRFDWQALKTDEFLIYWHEVDSGFGQNILNAAYEGLQRIQSHVTVPQPEGVAIYVYANVMELQEILLFSGQSAAWVAGHADPDLGVIMVSLPLGPDQNLEIKRQIPHELTHVLLYQKLGTGYDSLPQWLNEGLASTAELFPNPDYQVLLDKAYERGSLIPISDLCYRFPMDAANFQLSYAESTAFTRYLQQTYGKAAMEDLIQAYADGLGCAQGTEAAVGIPLTELEADWRQAMFNENAAFNALMEFAPWMLLLMAVLAAPVGLMILGARKRVAGGE